MYLRSSDLLRPFQERWKCFVKTHIIIRLLSNSLENMFDFLFEYSKLLQPALAGLIFYHFCITVIFGIFSYTYTDTCDLTSPYVLSNYYLTQIRYQGCWSFYSNSLDFLRRKKKGKDHQDSTWTKERGCH